MIRDTSLKSYEEIQEEGFHNTWQQEAYEVIRDTPLMTAREYFDLIIENGKREQIFPRITELKKSGKIIELGKRKCSVSGRLAYILATKEGIEIFLLKRLGFKQVKTKVFSYIEDDITLYQDFRNGTRKSYAYFNSGDTCDYKTLDIHKKFKLELDSLINNRK